MILVVSGSGGGSGKRLDVVDLVVALVLQLYLSVDERLLIVLRLIGTTRGRRALEVARDVRARLAAHEARVVVGREEVGHVLGGPMRRAVIAHLDVDLVGEKRDVALQVDFEVALKSREAQPVRVEHEKRTAAAAVERVVLMSSSVASSARVAPLAMH